jgi:hypothetical protein
MPITRPELADKNMACDTTSMTAGNDNILLATDSELRVEMARRNALQAMGIPSLVSIRDVAGAKPSVRKLIPNQKPVADLPVASVEATRPDAPRSPMSAAIPPTPVVETHQLAKRKAESVQFSMVLVAAGPFLWVEQIADGLIRQDQLALVAAMARAVSGSSVSGNHQQFDWPPAGASALNSDSDSAVQALQGLIQRLARDHEAKRVIVMGPCDYLPARIGDAGVRIPSTRAMLENPQLKATAWEALKPLRTLTS